MPAPNPDGNRKPLTDAERVAAQRAKWLERKAKKRGRQEAEPQLLSRGEWSGIRSGNTSGKVVR